MRIFLEQTQEFERDGVKHVAHGGAFYATVPDEVAEAWLAAGVAKRANPDNTIIEEPPPEPALPEIEAVPAEESAT